MEFIPNQKELTALLEWIEKHVKEGGNATLANQSVALMDGIAHNIAKIVICMVLFILTPLTTMGIFRDVSMTKLAMVFASLLIWSVIRVVAESQEIETTIVSVPEASQNPINSATPMRGYVLRTCNHGVCRDIQTGSTYIF